MFGPSVGHFTGQLLDELFLPLVLFFVYVVFSRQFQTLQFEVHPVVPLNAQLLRKGSNVVTLRAVGGHCSRSLMEAEIVRHNWMKEEARRSGRDAEDEEEGVGYLQQSPGLYGTWPLS